VTDWRQRNLDTYNKSAKELAEYFQGIGPRVRYIDSAFKAAGNPQDAIVVEIGCGDGRDATEIIKYTKNYIGFDIAEKAIKLARERLSGVKFKVGDAISFNYPKNLDIVFAFASLLHLNQTEIRQVLAKAYDALKPGGIFYISLKYEPKYVARVKKDQFGERLFYFYNPELIKKLAGLNYQVVDCYRELIGHTEWFEIILKKPL
jgi:SAM-dependent methyltransferase